MVKRKGDLFNQVCELKNIIEADKNARKNKKKSKQEIESHDKNILDSKFMNQKKEIYLNYLIIQIE